MQSAASRNVISFLPFYGRTAGAAKIQRATEDHGYL
jgi:hypothetical protein